MDRWIYNVNLFEQEVSANNRRYEAEEKREVADYPRISLKGREHLASERSDRSNMRPDGGSRSQPPRAMDWWDD